MAKINITGISPSDITVKVDPSGLISKTNVDLVKRQTVSAISEFIITDYKETIDDILDLYSNIGLDRKGYSLQKGQDIPTNYPPFSAVHSKRIISVGGNPATKPFWGSVYGDLAQYASRVTISEGKTKITDVDTKVTKQKLKSFFSQLITGKDTNKTTVLSLSASLSLPTTSSNLLNTLISQNYLKRFSSAVTFGDSLARPEGKRHRPEHAIAAEEDVRPLIRPVANLKGIEALERLNGSLSKEGDFISRIRARFS